MHPDEARRRELDAVQREVEKVVRYTEATLHHAESWPTPTATLVILCAMWRRLDAIEAMLEAPR